MHEIAEEDIIFFPFSTGTISPYSSWQFYWQPSFYLPNIPRTGPFTQLPFSLKSHGLSLGLLQDQPWSKATPFTYYNLLIKIILLNFSLDGIILLKPNRFLLELQLIVWTGKFNLKYSITSISWHFASCKVIFYLVVFSFLFPCLTCILFSIQKLALYGHTILLFLLFACLLQSFPIFSLSVEAS